MQIRRVSGWVKRPTFDDNEITCALHFQFDSKNSILEQQQHLEAGNSRNDKINKMHVRTSACSIRSPPGDEKLKVGRKLCKWDPGWRGEGGWPIDPSIKQSTKCGNAVQSQSSIIPQNKTQHDNILSFSRRNMEIVDIWVASDLQRAKRTANAICRDTRGKKGRSQVFPFFERRAAIGRRLGDRLMDPVTSLEEGAAATESFGLADLERGGLVFVRSRPFRESRWFFL